MARAGWLIAGEHCCRLSKKTKFEKRIAVTVFSFPPDKGNVGTAAYLNVFGSIHKVLKVSRSSRSPPSHLLRGGERSSGHQGHCMKGLGQKGALEGVCWAGDVQQMLWGVVP